MAQAGILVRPETRADAESIRNVCDAAFKGPVEGRLVEKIRSAEGFRRELSLVAEADGRVVGYALFSPVRIKRDDDSAEALTLAPLCVHPDFQKRGIGTALMDRGLSECRKAGAGVVVLLGHPEYYPRFGFKPAGEKGLRLPFSAPAEAFMALELVEGALGGRPGLVVFPSAFDEALAGETPVRRRP